MSKQLYKLLVDAVDEEGPFYQNFYAYGKGYDESIDSTMIFLNYLGYKDINIVEVEHFDVNYLPDEIIEDELFNGYIQNVKFAYPVEKETD